MAATACCHSAVCHGMSSQFTAHALPPLPTEAPPTTKPPLFLPPSPPPRCAAGRGAAERRHCAASQGHQGVHYGAGHHHHVMGQASVHCPPAPWSSTEASAVRPAPPLRRAAQPLLTKRRVSPGPPHNKYCAMLTLPIFPFSIPVHCKLGSSALIPLPRSACVIEPSAAGRRHQHVPASAAELMRAAARLAGCGIAWGCGSKVCGGRCKPAASLHSGPCSRKRWAVRRAVSPSADQFSRQVAIQIVRRGC